jgi:glycosyltransferase involved in cell wall biosynthesis
LFQEIVFIIFVACCVLQLFYTCYFFLKLAIHKDNFNTNTHLPVSIIVSAHNELENLKKLIPAILTQNYHHFELIIVNDRSFDDSEDFLKEKLKTFSSKLKVIKVEDTPSKMDSKKFALTLGIKAASYENLLFLDADCLPFNDKWLQQMQSKFTNEKQIVLGISQYTVSGRFLNKVIRYETFYTLVQYLSFALKGIPYMGIGRNLGYTKKVFFDSKGFHPHMDITGGDDDLFVQKVANSTNTAVAISIESQTVSIPKNTWKEWYVQKIRHISVGKVYSSKIKFLLGLLNITHFLMIITAILLIINGKYLTFVLVLFLLRTITNFTIFSLIMKKLRYKFNNWLVPFFDLLYPFYYLVIGIHAISIQKVRWK